MNLSFHIKSLVALVVISLSIQPLSALVIVEDNFDSYVTGTLTNSASWPTAIPGLSPAGSWFADGNGTQSIDDAASVGRSGNVYNFTETSSGDVPQSNVTLSSSFTGTDTWIASVDFRVASLANTSNYGLFRINDGANLIAQVRTFVSSGIYYVYGIASTGSKGGAFDYPNIATNINLDQWYNLTITGNNATGDLSYQVGGFALFDGYYYLSDTSQFNTFTIGDLDSGASGTSSIYMDDFSVVAVPEPGTWAFMGIAAAFLGLARRKRA